MLYDPIQRKSKAVINLNYLKKNYINLRRKAGGAKVMAVVKADAYGHGVGDVVKSFNTLKDNKPEYYAVALLGEGLELRSLNVRQPVLVFDTLTSDNIHYYVTNNLIPNIFTDDHLKMLSSYIRRFRKKPGTRFPVHIEVDTGMNRLGIDFRKAYNLIEKVCAHPDIYVDGIYTHFATADEEENSFAVLQLKRFDDLIKNLKRNNVNYGLAHAANSGAVLNYPGSYFDMIRPGVSLYGYYPSLKTSESVSLYPVMSLESVVGSVRRIRRGDSVSYGRRFISGKETTIFSLPLGYADGFRRSFTNKAKVIVNGRLYPQVGTVTMDRIMFDAGDDPVKVGQKAVLLGRNKDKEISVWDWSTALNTIPYEITCGISKRIPRMIKHR